MHSNAGASSRRVARARWFWAALLAGMFLLHQDCWNWARARPLIFGVLPPGLAYHALYAIGCAVVMALLVRFAWPRELELPGDDSRGEGGRGRGPDETGGRGETENRTG
ncbi:MAG: hypothetical protein RMK20_04200 [Verrucomicrobiales bacterium]|nr:hypothetical protein [Verrucomicrobiales bacterium]